VIDESAAPIEPEAQPAAVGGSRQKAEALTRN
jgi:hypothetical protein